MKSFDWPALMRAGMIGLRLPPDQFWALTPAEFTLMLGEGASAPMKRAGLEALMKAFPDEDEHGASQ
ncbi:phage tail assembly chaperone [Aliishimia ponticola]|uniref:Phage tail assembly chaperone n=1 Tax=Aliishimia ponticola TaxID=2499833 RepID=A0A4V3XKU7_9RHOB|nr:rcc01693 family protein [Aliishimia ponticola]THH38313.1 phage tail assembly chaperone [Aliishimia ponticola]